jgi:hypothetical protein
MDGGFSMLILAMFRESLYPAFTSAQITQPSAFSWTWEI